MKEQNILKWHEKYSVGIDRIDMEHKIFLDLIRNLQLEINKSVDKERIIRLILEIEKYAEFHFVSEENFMKLINFSDTERHIDLHFELLEKFNVVKHSDMSSTDFLDFVVNWFVNHTAIEDKQIYYYCIKNNIDINFKYSISNE